MVKSVKINCMVSMLIVRIIALFSLFSLLYACAPVPAPVPVSQPRVFKKPLVKLITDELPAIDKTRDHLFDRSEVIWNRVTPKDKAVLQALQDLEYTQYLGYNLAIAEGDGVAANYYKLNLFEIYRAEQKVLNKYAPSDGGYKSERPF